MKTTLEEVESFKPGVYRHYKGGLYRALFLGEDCTNREYQRGSTQGFDSTQEPTVAYVALDGPHAGKICFRELWQWNERLFLEPHALPLTKVSVPRFLWRNP